MARSMSQLGQSRQFHQTTATSGLPRRTLSEWTGMSQRCHVWTAPAAQEESDVSAKRSGAAMYPACFRLEDCLCRDAAAVAAGPDVIR